jgi:putative redox protein
MVEAGSLAVPYQTCFHAGEHSGRADTLKDGVGGMAGMRPHELLEAALATCLTITARMALEELRVRGSEVTVRVELERTKSTSTFRYSMELDPGLDEDQRDAVLQRIERSPVRQTLKKELKFQAAARDATRRRDSRSQ